MKAKKAVFHHFPFVIFQFSIYHFSFPVNQEAVSMKNEKWKMTNGKCLMYVNVECHSILCH